MANYLNRPSIFEIATAFEDGTNGYVSKQKEYEDVYNQLNDKEKSLLWRHPFLAMKIKENREKNIDISHGYFSLLSFFSFLYLHYKTERLVLQCRKQATICNKHAFSR